VKSIQISGNDPDSSYTSAYSALLKAHADVTQGIQQAQEIYINPIALGELHAGFRRGSRRDENEKDLFTFLSSARVVVTDIGTETARRYAEIFSFLRNAGTPIPTNCEASSLLTG
jgi:predicted nucleic acid-binding protein